MKLQVLLVAATLVAAAGPATAGDYGSWAPNLDKPKRIESKPFAPLPSTTASSTAPRTAATPPAATGFKPYEPFKSQSVYAQPHHTPGGAKPCELSVYVNACGK